jgi:hypothetical protein
MASSRRRTRASLQHELRQVNINISDDDWERRVDKRLSAVAITKNSAEYQTMIHRHGSAQRSGITLSDLPETPQAADRTVSKRRWERQLQQWRAAIKQWCRIEGVDLVLVISDSEGGIARLGRM